MSRPDNADAFAKSPWEASTLASIRGHAGAGINYPAAWPDSDYLLSGEHGYTMATDEGGVSIVHTPEGRATLDTFLAREGMTSLDRRTPVLTVGSNRAPRQLYDKLQRIPDATADDLMVPVFSVDVTGLDVVFAARPSFQGAFPAMAYAGEETAGTTVNLAVGFFNDRQLAMLDKTESGSYQRKTLADCAVTVGDRNVPIQFYDGTGDIFWDEQGPRALSAVRADGRTLSAYTQSDFMDIVVGHLQKHGGMDVLEGIYFAAGDPEHRQILDSYAHTPPYAQELAGHFFAGHIDAQEKPRMAGTAAVARQMGRFGLSKTVKGILSGHKVTASRTITTSKA